MFCFCDKLLIICLKQFPGKLQPVLSSQTRLNWHNYKRIRRVLVAVLFTQESLNNDLHVSCLGDICKLELWKTRVPLFLNLLKLPMFLLWLLYVVFLHLNVLPCIQSLFLYCRINICACSYSRSALEVYISFCFATVGMLCFSPQGNLISLLP